LRIFGLKILRRFEPAKFVEQAWRLLTNIGTFIMNMEMFIMNLEASLWDTKY